jgi:predicted GH43/DUF377 family glycosyl hydrolase
LTIIKPRKGQIMKHTWLTYIVVFLSIFGGCSKNTLTGLDSNNSSSKGSVSLKINRDLIPSQVEKIAAFLSRQNYDTLKTNIYVNSDSTSLLSFESVPIGEWDLIVNASNSEGKIVYSGQVNVIIIEDETIDVYLTLSPLGSGTGNINIIANWGNTWTDFYNNPVFTPKNNPDNPLAITQPRVILDNGIYKMWYLNLYNSAKSTIWYAESNDGLNWHGVQNGPVLVPGDSGSWDDYSVAPGIVIKEGDNYKMYYNGYHDQYGKWNIGLAISADGIHWEKYSEPILTADDQEYQIGVSSVLNVNNTYYLYYSVRHTPYYTISLATSSDGIHWIKHESNPILSPTKNWEGTGIYGPSVIYNQDHFEMVYMNADASAFGFAASKDGINWVRNSNPIFTADDTHNKWASRIAYPNLNLFNSEFRMYYTGYPNYSDGTIALATKFK